MTDESEPAGSARPSSGVLYAEPATPEPGWLPPPHPSPKASRDLQAPIAIGCVVLAALFLAGPLLFLAFYNYSSTPGQVQTVAFGRAGSGCEVTRTAESFPPGTLIRAVAMFSPELQAGARVTISVYRDGTELVDWRDVVPVEAISDCVFLGLTPLDPGRYRVEFALDTSRMPPASGEFEITAEPTP